ncbi:hypothetical protein PIB30_020050 [Stylosanthes scabra]|uniref:Protein kinase domain-containing protein n=1 Tax=Stylosanthes scabra TaxID=79078 RepID=A0ABU6TA52_9FABA|nr:hypothetical protein [Stylosanthes scabra]
MRWSRHSLFLLCFHFLFLRSAVTITTTINLSSPFSPSENVTLYGDAFFTDHSITLTTDQFSCSQPPSSSSGVGRAFYVYPVRFLDPQTNSTVSFTSRFSFSISSSASCPSPDGVAFLISSNTDFGTLSRGYLGLPAAILDQPQHQDSFFAVEFDTSFDPALGDINDNHVGVDLNSIVSFASVDTLSRGVDLKSGKAINVWIEYRDSMKMVRVWVSYSSTRPPSPILASQMDLSEQLKEFMHVGFSASNGGGSAVHVIDHWQFKTFDYGSREDVTPMDTVEEGNCVFCYPGELDLDSASSVQRNGTRRRRQQKISEMALGLGGITAFLVSVVAAGFVISIFLSKKKSNGNGKKNCRFQTTKVPMRLSLSEIKSATMGFNRDRLVGEGASAKVYKGSLQCGLDIAVKRFGNVDGLDCLHNPFATEFATMVSYLRHKNLVQLKGWCCEGNELLLVYEYLPNGSLNKVLHRNFNSSIVLTWKQRVNIVLGVASALTYLHEECERQIIHRDVKTCNIMLDTDFNAKLGDFGLAEVYEHSSSTRDATIPAGTMGYLAPEYVYSGVPTVKTDVYSFGVVVLEVATGRKPVEDDGTVMERMLLVGLVCVHPDYERRPRVRDAARILKKEAPLPSLPLAKPRVRIRPVCPNDTPETQNAVVGDWFSNDDAPYLTPGSQFY